MAGTAVAANSANEDRGQAEVRNAEAKRNEAHQNAAFNLAVGNLVSDFIADIVVTEPMSSMALWSTRFDGKSCSIGSMSRINLAQAREHR